MTLEERFWSKVKKGDGCWEWQAGKHSGGYGLFHLSRLGRSTQAHRVAYELTHGEIPAGMCILHACDNPPCVNPSHLRLGTQAENRADCVAKGRHWVPTVLKGTDNPRAKLTQRDCRAIQALRAAGVTRELLAEAFEVDPKTITATSHYLMRHIELTNATGPNGTGRQETKDGNRDAVHRS